MKLLAGPTLLLVAGIVICVEAVFVAESFQTIMEITIELGGTVSNALTLVALKSPEILDFGIPIALMVGVYFAVTRIREELAFVVCAAAGMSWVRIPVFTGLIGCAAGLISIVLSGFVIPETRHLQRLAIFDMHSRQVTAQLELNSAQKAVQELGGLTFISTSGWGPGGELARSMLVHFASEAGDWHVSLADDWAVEGPDEQGGYQVRLLNFSDYVGSGRPYGLSPENPGAEAALTRVLPDGVVLPKFSTLLVKNTSVEFNLDELLGAKDEMRRIDELILRDLTRGIGKEDSGAVLRLLAEKLARAILCPFAALAALLAAAVASGPKGRLTALPVATVALLGLDVVGRSLLVATTPGGELALVAGAALLLAASLLPVLAMLYFYGEKIILPFRDKTG